MAAEPFNSLGGFSVGIPAIEVVDSNGNVITNVLTTGNVAANTVYASYYKYANGQPFEGGGSPGGASGTLQYNNAGTLGGVPNSSWDGNLLTLGNVANVSILGGTAGYFLQTDGNGVLNWAAAGGGGNGSPGGSNSFVQYNDNGTFGGDAGFTYNETTNSLAVGNINVASNISASNGNISGILNVTGNITGNYILGNGYYLTGISANVANTVSNNAQPNITSVGTLTSLEVTGDILSYANITSAGNIIGGNLTVSRTVSASAGSFTSNVTVGGNLTVNAAGNLRSTGNVNFSGAPNINLGTLSNIHISGGVNGYVLSTDGTGNLTWSAGGGGGGNGVPGGSNTQIQYNDSGDFGGSPYLTFNEITNTFNIAGNLIANSIEIGSGVYKFSRSNVYFATTSTVANTPLISLVANTISSVDYTVIGTDPTSGYRQVSKLSAVMYDTTCNYLEYSTLNVNGFVGNFTVGFDPGNIISPPTVTLYVIPTSTNLSTYKVQMTVYEE